MKDNNWVNKVFYGTYLLIITLSTICIYMRDSKKKLPTPVMAAISVVSLLAFPAFLTAFVLKIKQRRAEAVAENEAVVPELELTDEEA